MENENDKRTIMAIGLSLLVYMVWLGMVSPPAIVPVEGVSSVGDIAVNTSVDEKTPSKVVKDKGNQAERDGKEAPVQAMPLQVVPERSVSMESTAWSGEILSREGSLTGITLQGVRSQPTVTPIWSHLMDKASGEDGEWHPYSGDGDPQAVLSQKGALVVAGAGEFSADVGYFIEHDEEQTVAKGRTATGLQITKTYRKTDNPNTVEITVRFDNQTGEPVSNLWVGVADEMDGDAGRFDNATRPFALIDESIERLDDLEDTNETGAIAYEKKASWFGVGDKYFMGVLIPGEDQSGTVSFASLNDGRYGAFWLDSQPLDSGASREHSYTAYIGAKNLDLVSPIGHDLDRSIEFGWFGFFAKALLWLLKMFQGFVVNWGVAIIALTLLVKLVFFPLMQKQFISSKRMQVLQPELKALKERYKDNKELQTQMTMKLFKEHEVNPMGGCLPMVIQMPVWFALYNVMLFSVELYNTSFLYLEDLTQVDPYGVLPLLVSVLMLLQQKMMPMANMDPMQQKMMRMMPLMFGIFMFSFPSGLVLYFSVNNSLTILQQWIIYRDIDKSPVSATT
jgi:YidC/Oxa1 family membrane protein insertase